MNAQRRRANWTIDYEDAWERFELEADEDTLLATAAYLMELSDSGEPSDGRLLDREKSSDIYMVDMPLTTNLVIVRMIYVPRRLARLLMVRSLEVLGGSSAP